MFSGISVLKADMIIIHLFGKKVWGEEAERMRVPGSFWKHHYLIGFLISAFNKSAILNKSVCKRRRVEKHWRRLEKELGRGVLLLWATDWLVNVREKMHSGTNFEARYLQT